MELSYFVFQVILRNCSTQSSLTVSLVRLLERKRRPLFFCSWTSSKNVKVMKCRCWFTYCACNLCYALICWPCKPISFITVLCTYINITDGKIQTEAGTPVTLQHVLVFFTGADREPPLGFPTKASLEFLKEGDVLATASTCDLTLRVPTAFHDNYDRFKNMMVESLISGSGFGVA